MAMLLANRLSNKNKNQLNKYPVFGQPAHISVVKAIYCECDHLPVFIPPVPRTWP